MVIAKQSDIGNCLLWNLNGKPKSEGTESILGIKFLSPTFFVVITVVEMTFFS